MRGVKHRKSFSVCSAKGTRKAKYYGGKRANSARERAKEGETGEEVEKMSSRRVSLQAGPLIDFLCST